MATDKVVKLSDIADILNGYAFKSSEYQKSGYRVIRITNVQKGVLVDDDPKFYSSSETLNRYELQQDDILISLTGNVGRVGLVSNSILPAYLNQRVGCIRIKSEDIDNNYLFHLLNDNTFEKDCINNSNGIAQLNMSTEWLKNVRIKLPPLEEQQKIARILDKANEIRTKKRLANAKLDEFLKSTFIDMFGDPVLNTKNLEVVKVIDVCECMVPGRDKPKSFTGNIPWITIDDLKINGITYKSKNNLGLTEQEIDEVKRKTIPTGSVIMSCVGNLGLCSIAGIPMIINQQLHSFQCSDKINNIYLMYILGQMKYYMNKQASSTTVLYMNKTVCNSIPIMLPSIELQNKFAEIVEKVEEQKQKNEQAIEQMDNLFNSLSQRAFKGEL